MSNRTTGDGIKFQPGQLAYHQIRVTRIERLVQGSGDSLTPLFDPTAGW